MTRTLSRKFPKAAAPAAAFAVLAAVLLTGIVIGERLARTSPVTITDDLRPRIGTVQIDGIENGMLKGSVHGEARLFLVGKPVATAGSGAFAVPARELLINTVPVLVPEGMRFVASRRGSKYYPVDSPGGEKLTPENRVYFRTAEEAEDAGYRR